MADPELRDPLGDEHCCESFQAVYLFAFLPVVQEGELSRTLLDCFSTLVQLRTVITMSVETGFLSGVPESFDRFGRFISVVYGIRLLRGVKFYNNFAQW